MSKRPVHILISALGGEGGGVLTDWVVEAALEADFPVQATSIPGVAQRTGATTYYVEIYPETNAALNNRRPVLGLYPSPGDIDVMVATEMLEIGRALENGHVTPEKTTLIGNTSRMYATAEKMAMTDNRFDGERVMRAAREIPARSILFDLPNSVEGRGLALNGVMFGIMCGIGVLPLTEAHFRAAITKSGKQVDANMKAFELGLAMAAGKELTPARPASAADGEGSARQKLEPLEAARSEAARLFPAECLDMVEIGLERCADYQDVAYARLYLERMKRALAFEGDAGKARGYRLTAEIARYLALWMTYEDVIRVGDLKSRSARFAKVRAEIRAKDHEPVQLTEFLKPGVEEISAILPRSIGRRLLRWGEKTGRLERLNFPMHLKSNRLNGFLRLWILGRMKALRPMSLRYHDENEQIERWLDAMQRAVAIDHGLAVEIAQCQRLLKGYSDTFRRGKSSYHMVFEQVVLPAVDGADKDGARKVRLAREAALSDPEGQALADAVSRISTGLRAAAE